MFDISVLAFEFAVLGRFAGSLGSTSGGFDPRWSPDGTEIFYRHAGRFMAVEVATTPELSVGPPQALFEASAISYDVAPDGEQFVLIQEGPQYEPSTELNVVLNWFEELEQQTGRMR